ncbi:F0F1 ATP synthase subunit delta [Oceanicola granulosus]|uniref:F0F1 ATP synthase subunit delta n=1 Tax=Oceanicola granulosus TaxID=252302 RepID=UPI0009FBB637|nr:F0F1 ATP synthase subunit delta [Oceanicola granulosus]
MSEPASISTGISQRYATAVFELYKEGDALSALENDIETLESALAESADLRDLLHSPLYAREGQADAIRAIAEKAGLSDTMRDTLTLMAQKRRLFVVPQMLRALRERLNKENGVVTADVVSAKALTKTQSDKLASTLKSSVGSDVKINATVDESLIGGLVIKVGSKMIDTSISSKLAALQNTMKEAR